MKVNALQERRRKAVEDARGVANVAEAAGRDMNAEEEARFDAFIAESDRLETLIERAERLEGVEGEIGAVVDQYLDRDEHGEYRAGFGERGATRQEREVEDAIMTYVQRNEVRPELRAMQADSDTGGGIFLPQTMQSRIIQNLDKRVVVRQYATVLPLSDAASLGVIQLDEDTADPVHKGEIEEVAESDGPTFGKRELNPRHMAKLVKVSNTLLRKHPAILSFLEDRIAYRFGHQQEEDFMLGNGAGNALGVFFASDAGIPTGRDVSTGNTATEITYDGTLECYFSMEEEYLNEARWLFHRQAKKQLAMIKDGEGRPMWVPGVGGAQDTLHGLPCDSSRFAPSTFTAGQYVGLLACWQYYWIAEALTMRIQRLVEKFATSNQTGFLASAEIDGMPVLAEAFSRMKLGS